MGETGSQQRRATQARRPNLCASRQCIERRVGWRNEGVARIFTRQNRSQGETLGQLHRDIFEGMHRKIGPPVHQRRFEFLGKQTFSAHLVQGAIQNLVTLRRHPEQCDRPLRQTGRQKRPDVFSLPKRQATLAGGDDHSFRGRLLHHDPLLDLREMMVHRPRRPWPKTPAL